MFLSADVRSQVRTNDSFMRRSAVVGGTGGPSSSISSVDDPSVAKRTNGDGDFRTATSNGASDVGTASKVKQCVTNLHVVY